MKRARRKKPKPKPQQWPLYLVAGFLAVFFLWIYWTDIEEFTRPAWNRLTPERAKAPATPEDILDQEKKQLERILKQG